MTDLEPILRLWKAAEAAGQEYVLATVTSVEGSSYRKPGARMLLVADGRRVGTVSGGCLEAEVMKRAFWRTANGPVVESYSTVADDDIRPYGSGCGGTVWILLERAQTARPLLEALQARFSARKALAVATVLDGSELGQRGLAWDGGTAGAPELAALASTALQTREGALLRGRDSGRIWTEYQSARPALWIFGAGDDAQPLVRMAQVLGWWVVVADGRSHLVTRERFPEANQLMTLPMNGQGANALGATLVDVRAADAAVLMTHSYDQDLLLLSVLGFGMSRPAYLGVLGPKRRTRELMEDAKRLRGDEVTDDSVASEVDSLHAPVGLDLGGETPASIALAILAQAQMVLSGSSGRSLK